MTRHLADVPATTGEPFQILKFTADKLMIRRMDNHGRSNALIVSKADAIALTNALIDVIEGEP